MMQLFAESGTIIRPALSDWWAVCVSAPISPVSLPGLFLKRQYVRKRQQAQTRG